MAVWRKKLEGKKKKQRKFMNLTECRGNKREITGTVSVRCKKFQLLERRLSKETGYRTVTSAFLHWTMAVTGGRIGKGIELGTE